MSFFPGGLGLPAKTVRVAVSTGTVFGGRETLRGWGEDCVSFSSERKREDIDEGHGDM